MMLRRSVLDEELLQKGLTYVGTIRSNKPEIPDEMRPAKKQRSTQLYLWIQNQGDISILCATAE